MQTTLIQDVEMVNKLARAEILLKHASLMFPKYSFPSLHTMYTQAHADVLEVLERVRKMENWNEIAE